ncbi:MAG: ribosome assembly factor SBDS [archaeon]|nr:MAG: ribosome assembly factor SBDS [archaeon]
MPNIIARLRIKNKSFEILVDCDKAVDFKKGKLDKSSINNILVTDEVFTDNKKGLRASNADLKDFFGSENISDIAEKIIKQGELQLPQQYREKAREQKLKQIVDFLTKNGIDPRTNMPYTATVVETAIKDAGVKIEENKDAASQAVGIIKQLESKLPIKISTKRIVITVPPEHTGRVYSLFQKVKKEKEEWLNDGSLKCTIELPAGMQMDFYDKLNNMTHGSAVTEELKND